MSAAPMSINITFQQFLIYSRAGLRLLEPAGFFMSHQQMTLRTLPRIIQSVQPYNCFSHEKVKEFPMSKYPPSKRSLQRLLEVGDDVIDVLNSNRNLLHTRIVSGHSP
jgi:hypothetical protein